MSRYFFGSAAVLVFGPIFGPVQLLVLVLVLVLILVLILVLVLIVHRSLPPGSFTAWPLE